MGLSNSKKIDQSTTPPSTPVGRKNSKPTARQLTPPLPPPVQPSETANMYVALYDYEARADEDLTFKEQDHLEITDKSNADWWHARNLVGEEGWIPSNYVAPLASISAETWFFGKTSRPQADKLLMHRGNQTGAFLIRESDSQPGQYALSVRNQDKVNHYRIRTLDLGGYFIGPLFKFSTLHDLIKHYANSSGGLCCCLTIPCVLTQKPVIGGLAKDKWEIPRKELQKGDMLGSGQFGDVYKGFWNKKTLVAIKTLKAESADVEQFLKEAQVMKTLIHPKLVQLYGVCTIGKPMFIVIELVKNGALLDYLRSPDGKDLTIVQLVDMAAQVAEGMAFLEQKNYIHRDLAARNVLLGEENNVKIADFGMARAIPNDIYIAQIGAKFPVKWTAPEAMGFNQYTIKSDVWSFGVLLTELVTYGRIPYPGMSNPEYVLYLENGHRMDCPTNCPNHLYSLMLQCWDKEPRNRPTFETLHFLLDSFTSDGEEYQEPEP